MASRIRSAAASARSGVGKVAITTSPIVLTTAPASDATTSCKTRKCARTRSKAARSPTRVKLGRSLQVGEQEGEARDLQTLVNVQRVSPEEVAKGLVCEKLLGRNEWS